MAQALSSEQTWGTTAPTGTLEIVDTVEELRDLLPAELYVLVAAAAEEPDRRGPRHLTVAGPDEPPRTSLARAPRPDAVGLLSPAQKEIRHALTTPSGRPATDLRMSLRRPRRARRPRPVIAAGTVLALLGPNGAGKTTTVNVLSTLLRADAGRPTVCGHDVATRPGGGARRSIGVTGQFSAVDGLLTGTENLLLMADLHHLPRAEGRSRGGVCSSASTSPTPPASARPTGRAACSASSTSP